MADLTWPSGHPFDPARAYQLSDDLRAITAETGNCRPDDGADMIDHLLLALGFTRPPLSRNKADREPRCQICTWLREYDNGAFCGRVEPKKGVEMNEVCKHYTPPTSVCEGEE